MPHSIIFFTNFGFSDLDVTDNGITPFEYRILSKVKVTTRKKQVFRMSAEGFELRILQILRPRSQMTVEAMHSVWDGVSPVSVGFQHISKANFTTPLPTT